MFPVLRPLFHITILGQSPLARYRDRPPPRRVEHPHTVIFVDGTATPENAADTNFAFVTGSVDPAQFFAWTTAACGDPKLCSILLEVETAPELDRALVEAGWHLDEEEPALVLSPVPARVASPPADLELRRVVTESDLDAFAEVSPGVRSWVPSVAAATDPDVALFIGYVDGTPVATARVACVTGHVLTDPSAGLVKVADVTGVGTLETHRRRGFGTAMTWAAVAFAASRDCDAVALNASEMGYPVYLKMGFTPVATYRTYLPPG